MSKRGARGTLAILGSLLIGCSSTAPIEELGTRSFALERVTWNSVTPGAPATARSHHLFAYDEAQLVSLVFGGRLPSNTGASLADTGTWNGSAWAPVGSVLGRRSHLVGVFDSARERTVTYGGADIGEYFDDTWEFDGKSWSRRDGAGAPGKRASYGLAFDRERAVTVLFGGYNGVWKGDVWEWDGVSWTERCNSAPCSTAPRPAARANPVFVYDQARKVSVLFGGFGGGTSYADTWTWDGERWTSNHPAFAPSGRDSAAATYEPISGRVLIFGGVQDLQESNELWAWDGVDWSPLSAVDTPSARQGAGFAWDVARARGVLFGGSATGSATDAWELLVTPPRCSAPQDCVSGACVDGTCSSSGGVGAGGTAGAGGGSGASAGSSTAGAGIGEGGTGEGGRGEGGIGEGGIGEGGNSQLVDPKRGDEAGQARQTQSLYSCAVASSLPTQGSGRIALGGLCLVLAWCWARRRTRLRLTRPSRREIDSTFHEPRPAPGRNGPKADSA